MDLLDHRRAGEKMLAHLLTVLEQEHPHINPATLGMDCELEHIHWWQGRSTTPFEDFVKLLQKVSALAPGIGLAVARQSQITDMGMMGYAMLTTKTLRDFVRTAAYALDQFSYPITISIIPHTQITECILFQNKSISPAVYFKFIEFSMALAWHYIQSMQLVSTERSPTAVLLTGDTQTQNDDNKRLVERHFRTSVTYGAELNAIVMPAGALDAVLPAGNLEEIVECSVQCKKIISDHQFRDSMKRRVQRALLEAPHLCQFSAGKTAKHLGIQERAMRSALKAENLLFRDLAMRVRMELAEEYLNATNFSIQRIAYMLSYSEPNNFIRAFTSRFGVPPARYREQQRNHAMPAT